MLAKLRDASLMESHPCKKTGGVGVAANTDFDPTTLTRPRCLQCLPPSVRIAAGFFPERKPFQEMWRLNNGD
jgi:hypothetical protein